MKVSKEVKKKEAIKRMKKMGIIKDAIDQFESDDMVMQSEPQKFLGITIGALYYLNDDQKRIVTTFEADNNALVYMVVRSYTNIGIMDSIFYVSDHKEEWEMDNADLNDGYCPAYVVNYDMPDCSEFGTIGWKESSGGIVRVF